MLSKTYGWLIAAAGGIGLLITAYFKGKSEAKEEQQAKIGKTVIDIAARKRKIDDESSSRSPDAQRERLRKWRRLDS